MLRHEAWLRERLETDAFVFSTMNLPAADVVVTVDDARIIDYGAPCTGSTA